MEALIDGDIVLYRSALAAEYYIYKVYIVGEEANGHIASFRYKKEADEYVKSNGEEDLFIEREKVVEPFEHARQNIETTITHILNETGVTKYKLFVSGEGNYRYEVDPEYKANRKDQEKPVHYEGLVSHLVDNWGAEIVDTIEADDAMGVEQMLQRSDEGLSTNEHTSIICTLDKDLNMIPGWHYNWVKEEKYFVEEEQAIYHFYLQLITGDSVDNITGIPKYGPVKAKRVLDGTTTEYDMYSRVRQAYQEYYGEDVGDEELWKNANLLWIKREKCGLWFPPNK